MLDRPSGLIWREGRAAGGLGIKNTVVKKGLIVCWNKGNRRVWLEMSDCLLESRVGKGAGPVWVWFGLGNSPKGCLIAPNQY